MFIDGKFVENESGKWIQVVNPSTEEVISLMPDGTVDDARKAIDAAEKAQAQWEKTPSNVRASYLTRIAAGIRKREKELPSQESTFAAAKSPFEAAAAFEGSFEAKTLFGVPTDDRTEAARISEKFHLTPSEIDGENAWSRDF